MKKTVKNILLIFVLAVVVVVTSFALSACGLLESITGEAVEGIFLSNNGTFSIGSVTPIDGYGYDPAQCDLQKGVYHRLYTQQQ